MAAAEERPVCGCVQGHRPSLQLPTEAGGCICLMCFIKLLADSSAFLTHKLYAVSELRQALHDPLFSAEFLHHHRHFVVAPLSEALAVCRDDRSSDLAKAFMELILDLCRLNEVAALDPVPVLHDFVLHIVLQLGSSSGLTCTTGQSYTLHVLGLLLDNYCKYGNVMPDAIRNHRGFLINLIAGLKLPGDQLRGEILFLLYKLSSFEDGISEVLPFLPDLIDSALNALVKSESDELRTNCIALLNTLAQQSTISIRFQQISLYTEAVPEEENGFARAFADAIKGSLISSDSHVQVAALQLLCHMCPPGVALASDLQILIEEGIMDYIFEILRVCENKESIVAWSIRALSMLSGARDAFTQRFAIGLETVNWVLDCSVETALCAVQPDILLLIGFGLTGCPGAISTMRAEHLLQTLTAILNQFAGDNFSLLNEVFDLTCSALAALLKLPCTSGIQDVDLFIETAISSTFITVSAAGPADFECQALKHAILLLSEAFAFSLKTHDLVNFTLADVLIEVCETSLLPMFIKNFQFLEDEDTVLAALGAFLRMVDKPDFLGSTRLAKSLATASWFSLSYELMGRFPAQNMKDVLMMLLGNVICRLERNGLDEDVKAQFIQLPGDPQDLLVLLALSSIHDPQLKLTQFAIITILYISQLYGDRLAEEVHILACLEQYLLMNSSALCEDSHLSSIIKRLLYIYVFTMEAVTSCSVPCSLETENLLVSLIEHCQSDFISSKMPKNVFTWLLQKESLGNYMMAGMLKWFKTFVQREQDRCHNGATLARGADNEVGSSEDLSFFLVSLAEDNCCGVLFNHLLDEVLARQAEEDIKIVVDCYIRFVKLSALAANQLCICGIVSNVRNWLAIYSSRLPGVFGCLIELLYQLLCALSCDGALDEESWHLLASQFVYTLADKLNGFAGLAAEEEVLILLSLMTLILHKSVENMGFLTQASGAILSNQQLQKAVNLLLAKAGAQGSKISKLDPESSDGKLLSCTLAFHLLCLRCTIIMLKPAHQKMSSTQPYLKSLTEEHFSLCTLVLPKSYEQVEHLCRMLYFGPQFLKVLSSSCLAEAFYGLTHTGTSHADPETADAHKGLRALQSIVMVLQGSMFDSSLIVRRNCSFCLYSLITNANLNDREKEAVHGSSWHRFLVEEFVLALSTPGWASEPVPGTIYVAIGLLKMSSPPKWANSVLSPFCISAIISSLTPKKLTVATVVLLKELQSKGCLEGKHMEALHKILQMSRKTVYGENCNFDDSSLQQHDQRHNACSSNCRQDSDAECLRSHNHVANLAVSYYLDPLTGVRQCSTDPNRSTALVTLIDEFLQETNSVTQRHAQP